MALEKSPRDQVVIGGVEPASMLERPGLISTIVFIKGCNFRCPFCHNPELVNQDPSITPYPLTEFFDLLDKKQGWVDSVIFTGGEPTIFPALPRLMKKVKQKGFEIGLHTNGTNPRMIQELLADQMLDYLAMDLKGPLKKYAQIAGAPKIDLKAIKESIQLIKQAAPEVDTVFRTTIVPGLIEVKDIPALGRLIKGASRISLQQFRPLKCLDKKYESVAPYPTSVLNQMADDLEKYVKEVDREFI